ncbi:MAG: cyclase family protein [Blastocatellia bacterium]|nr:cyclase family protein [Blastocatellia bacterium]
MADSYIQNMIDISIPIRFNGPQPNAFGVDTATAVLLGDTRKGSSVNFDQYTFIPHCNGTHTECVGHITDERISILDCLQDVMMPAMLVSVEPELLSEPPASAGGQFAGDKVISAAILRSRLSTTATAVPKALIIRTLPNDGSKLERRYDTDNIPPYFAADAIEYIVECGFKHLLVDLPSLDRLDDPTLPAHRAFWNVEMGSHEVNDATRMNSTITELIYVPNEVADGEYTLNLQIAPFDADAAPSRPILLRKI